MIRFFCNLINNLSQIRKIISPFLEMLYAERVYKKHYYAFEEVYE